MEQKNINNGKTSLAVRSVIMIAIACMFICQFLPYASARKEFANRLKEYKDEIFYDKLDLTCGDVVNVSMVEFTRINMSERDDGTLYVILVSCIGGFTLLAGWTAFRKKNIKTIVFAGLAGVAFWLQSWDYKSRGVIPSDNYGWGIGYYLFIVAVVIVIGGSIYMKIYSKKKNKIQVEIENA